MLLKILHTSPIELTPNNPVKRTLDRTLISLPLQSAALMRRSSQRQALVNDIVSGPGGKQILCLDPSGNVIELFESAGE